MAKFEHQYSDLDAADRKDPLAALSTLCDQDELFSLRRDITSMLISAMDGQLWEDDTPTEKSSRVWTCRTLFRLAELGFLICRHVQTDQIKYTPTFEPYYD